MKIWFATDILAGERGPSCKKMCQIPDYKVFYVPFIKMRDAEVSNDQDEEEHGQETQVMWQHSRA